MAYGFQSLKRDVAFFHLSTTSSVCAVGARVSIAQARCGLLPLGFDIAGTDIVVRFQSLKRDVAFFHANLTPTGYWLKMVSIAQARCGLLPRYIILLAPDSLYA